MLSRRRRIAQLTAMRCARDHAVQERVCGDVCGQHSRDDDAHVPWLVDEVRFVRPPGSIGVLQREHRCGDDVAGLRPGPEEPEVRRGGDREAVTEDDQRERAGGAIGRGVGHVHLTGGALSRVADNRGQDPGPRWLSRHGDRAGVIDEGQLLLAHCEGRSGWRRLWTGWRSCAQPGGAHAGGRADRRDRHAGAAHLR